MDTKVKDSLDKVRASGQELHAAISDAAAKRGTDAKAAFQEIPGKLKGLNDSVKASMAGQSDTVKKHLTDAMTNLQEAQKHASDSLKANGEAFQSSVRQTLANTRTSVQNISEAVAAKRATAAAN